MKILVLLFFVALLSTTVAISLKRDVHDQIVSPTTSQEDLCPNGQVKLFSEHLQHLYSRSRLTWLHSYCYNLVSVINFLDIQSPFCLFTASQTKSLIQRFSTWSTHTTRGTREAHRGYAKLKKSLKRISQGVRKKTQKNTQRKLIWVQFLIWGYAKRMQLWFGGTQLPKGWEPLV
jgi:hypothetical protein